MRPFIGCIILAMLAVNLFRRWRGDPNAPAAHPWPYGLAAGFSSTVANAAGPVMNLYMISMRLPKEEFVATGAWLFFFVNLAKIPVYIWHRLFSRESLIFDAALIPITLLGAYFGRWVVHVIPQRVFELLVLAMTCISTLLLFR